MEGFKKKGIKDNIIDIGIASDDKSIYLGPLV